MRFPLFRRSRPARHSSPRPAILNLEHLEERALLTADYVSPYAITGIDPSTVTASLAAAENNTQAPIPQDQWYNQSAYNLPGAPAIDYGPVPDLLAPVNGPATTSAQTQAYIQSVLAVESSLNNITPYQHHHDTNWDPYTNGYSSNPSDANYWPWQQVNTGTGTAGIDCSNLTALAYNVGAGIFLNSSTEEQAVVALSANGQPTYVGTSPPHWEDAAGTAIQPQFILGPNFAYDPTTNTNYITQANTPGQLQALESKLQPGDLLYITDFPGATPATPAPASGQTTLGSATLTLDSAVAGVEPYWTVSGPGIPKNTQVNAVNGNVLTLSNAATVTGSGSFQLTPPEHNVTHVVMWLGSYGTLADGSPSPVPLVISSHDNAPAITDANGVVPPPGVHILPFQDNWFYDNFCFAMRVLPTLSPDPQPTPTPTPSPTPSGPTHIGVPTSQVVTQLVTSYQAQTQLVASGNSALAQQQQAYWLALAYQQSPSDALALVWEEYELVYAMNEVVNEVSHGVYNPALGAMITGLVEDIAANPLYGTDAGYELGLWSGAVAMGAFSPGNDSPFGA